VVIDESELVDASATGTLGDVDLSGTVTFLDIAPFIDVLSGNEFQFEADCDQNGEVNFLDIAPFIDILSGT
jgi:CRISPR/Cas system CMR subunit Cmr6 (Cas7 group RAMP superfamily)